MPDHSDFTDLFDRAMEQLKNPSLIKPSKPSARYKEESATTAHPETRVVTESDTFRNTPFAHAYDQYGSLKRRYAHDPGFRILSEHIDNEFGGITIQVSYEHSELV